MRSLRASTSVTVYSRVDDRDAGACQNSQSGREFLQGIDLVERHPIDEMLVEGPVWRLGFRQLEKLGDVHYGVNPVFCDHCNGDVYRLRVHLQGLVWDLNWVGLGCTAPPASSTRSATRSAALAVTRRSAAAAAIGHTDRPATPCAPSTVTSRPAAAAADDLGGRAGSCVSTSRHGNGGGKKGGGWRCF